MRWERRSVNKTGIFSACRDPTPCRDLRNNSGLRKKREIKTTNVWLHFPLSVADCCVSTSLPCVCCCGGQRSGWWPPATTLQTLLFFFYQFASTSTLPSIIWLQRRGERSLAPLCCSRRLAPFLPLQAAAN